MIALCIIIGIIVLIALVLNIRAHIHVEYEDEVTAYAKWAFLKIPLLPRPEKEPKPKKEKKKEEPKEEPKEEKEPKPKGPNPLKTFYENEKLEGILDILRRLLSLIDKFGRRLANSFVIDEMFLDITVSRDDASETALEYGKVSQVVFPVAGAVCANCNVRKYSINIDPDYIGKGYNEYAFSLEISLNPRKLINAVLAFVFGAVFKLGIKIIKSFKKKDNGGGEQNDGKNDGDPKNPDGTGGETSQNTENPDDPNKPVNAEIEFENLKAAKGNDQTVQIPMKQVVYGKYDDGTVKEPEIYIDKNNNDNNVRENGE
ncbi:MAG: hypothetical protein LUH40_01510 [Clostridiales bacterium]|nr:hypothetical protein [Clostridiales bacterium]